MHGKKFKVKNLKDYIQGNKKGKKAHDLEREAMQDPFLQDALEGYDLVEGNHINTIDKLKNQILKKTEKKKIYTYYYIAASIIILFFIGAYFFMNNTNKENKMFVNHTTSKNEVITNEIQENKKNENVNTNGSFEKENKVYNKLFISKNKKNLKIDEEKKDNNLETLSLALQNNSIYLEQSLSDYRMKHADNAITFPSNIDNNEKNKTQNLDTLSIAYHNNSVYFDHPLSAQGMIQIDKTIRTSPSLTKNLENEKYDNKKDSNLDLDSKKTNRLSLINKNTSKSEQGNSQNNKDQLLGSINVDRFSELQEYDAVPVIGDKLYKQYLKDHMHLFKNNKCKSDKGDIVISFSVSEQGRPYNFIINKSLCSEKDEKIIDLIKNGADWKGKKGKVYFTK